jgi:hypothetical protein
VQNGSDIYRTECFPSPLTDDVIINVLAPSTFCFFIEILKGRAYRVWAFLSVFNIICILNGIINKKIKTQTTKETVFPK